MHFFCKCFVAVFFLSELRIMKYNHTKALQMSGAGSGILLLILIITGLFCLRAGSCQVPLSMVFKTILSHLIHWPAPDTIPALNHTIIWEIRLPRILLAATAGICLSVSGVVFQGCFRNPLVEPYVLGASSGAAFGAALGIVFPAFFLSVQIMAFVFAALAVMIAYTMARNGPDTPVCHPGAVRHYHGFRICLPGGTDEIPGPGHGTAGDCILAHGRVLLCRVAGSDDPVCGDSHGLKHYPYLGLET